MKDVIRPLSTTPFPLIRHILSTRALPQTLGAFNSSFDVGMHNGSVTQAFEWDTYGYFVGCNVLGPPLIRLLAY